MCVLSIKVPIQKSLETYLMILVYGKYKQAKNFFLSFILVTAFNTFSLLVVCLNKLI